LKEEIKIKMSFGKGFFPFLLKGGVAPWFVQKNKKSNKTQQKYKLKGRAGMRGGVVCSVNHFIEGGGGKGVSRRGGKIILEGNTGGDFM